MPYYRLADVMVVSSLHDGMNLVAKEYVASRVDGQSALILSPFTGASRELTAAYTVNPFNPENIADALFEALEPSDEDRSTRMENLRLGARAQYLLLGRPVSAGLVEPARGGIKGGFPVSDAAQHRPSQRKNLDLAPEEVQATKFQFGLDPHRLIMLRSHNPLPGSLQQSSAP